MKALARMSSIALLGAMLLSSSICAKAGGEVLSMYQIMASPKSHNEQKVVVQGVLGVFDDTVALFVDEGSKNAQVFINAFLITHSLDSTGIANATVDDLKQMDGKYVMVWGTYKYADFRERNFTGGLHVDSIGRVPIFPSHTEKLP